jgi:hypothetical protein
MTDSMALGGLEACEDWPSVWLGLNRLVPERRRVYQTGAEIATSTRMVDSATAGELTSELERTAEKGENKASDSDL